MADLVYPPVIAFAKTMFRALNMKITILGEEHVPASGGAVIACNHISYLDFIFCGLGARRSRRLVRFMAKEEIFRNRVGGPLMRGMHHIPVDRDAGMASYKAALAALKAGEVVGVFPEATIDQSFTIKDFKSGAVRLAAATGTPLVPMVLWGTQRFWTKGRPRDLTQRGVAITISMGEPLHPTRRDNGDTVSAELRSRMKTMLSEAQRGYPQQPAGPDDRWWLPAHLGGTAPEPEVLEAEAQ
ncbi:lysophospholipid acyltransferase family protein [Dactylosporangium sp. NPDC051541]|uniref:lysophospholipid acyltransferase family protein n=1 Tax=Dactylosporangium sp. NPDC051541 TaxID=3363977 RepID=UPI0037935363